MTGIGVKPSGFTEELALEQAAALEHEQASREAWLVGSFAESWRERQAAEAARRRIAELTDSRQSAAGGFGDPSAQGRGEGETPRP